MVTLQHFETLYAVRGALKKIFKKLLLVVLVLFNVKITSIKNVTKRPACSGSDVTLVKSLNYDSTRALYLVLT